jgi:hypothetical protein
MDSQSVYQFETHSISIPAQTIPSYDDLPAIPKENLTLNQQRAQIVIHQTYEVARATLYASDSDSFRLRIHSSRLMNRIIPILVAMEAELPGYMEWFTFVTTCIAELAVEIEGAAASRDLK